MKDQLILSNLKPEDRVVIDTISDPATLSLWALNSNTFRARPQQAGSFIRPSPNGARVYLVCDDGTGDKSLDHSVTAVIIPQYLHVG